MEFIRNQGKGTVEEREVRLKEGTLPLLYFPLLEETGLITHCFTTRQGGVSQGVCASLNLSFTRGDDPKAVEQNFQRVAEALGVTTDRFVLSHQTHTTNVRKVGKEDAGCGITREDCLKDVDGLITNEPGLVLSTFYADCVPLYFLDPVHKAIGLSHSGWRGTVGRMGRETLKAMEREYQTRPKDTLCVIGPSICQDCYEVSQDVIQAFSQEFGPGAREFYVENARGRYQLDLWKANEAVLEEAGVKREHIATAGLCTCCNHKLLFSHRASGGKRGNLGAFFMLKQAEESNIF